MIDGSVEATNSLLQPPSTVGNAKGLQKLGRIEEAIIQSRKSAQSNSDFKEATNLLNELTVKLDKG